MNKRDWKGERERGENPGAGRNPMLFGGSTRASVTPCYLQYKCTEGREIV